MVVLYCSILSYAKRYGAVHQLQQQSIADGIETTDIDLESNEYPHSPESTQTGLSDSPEIATGSVDSPEDTDTSSTPGPSSSSGTVKERRDLLNAKLKGYKGEKLKRKLPSDSQLLTISQEEVEIKKQLLEKMDNMDKVYINQMDKLTSNLEKLTGSISDGFALMRQIMCPTPGPGMMQSHYMAPQANYPPVNFQPTHNEQFSYMQSLHSDDQC